MTRSDARNIYDIVEEIKDIISLYIDDKVYDYQVSEILRIKQNYFATMKRRGTIPYAEILDFCRRTGLDPMKIFYEEPV